MWVIPLKTVSESNARGWRAKAARTQEARAKVTRALGRHLAAVVPFSEAFHAGRKVRVTFTRLGGGRMDGSNLHAAFKAAEDAVAMIAGADDGAANWRCDVLQEPGGDVGVRIQLAVEGV